MAQPGYLLVLGHSLDGAKMAAYAAALPPIYKKYDGHYIGIGGPGRGVELLEGGWFDHSLVLARFPSRAQVEKFWTSPEYTEAKPLRKDAGHFQVFAMTGLAEPPKGQPAFLISIYREFDPAQFKVCADTEADILKRRELGYLARAKYADVLRLEGDVLDFDFAIISLPTQAAATNLWNDPQYRAMREQRAKVAGVNTFLMAGLPSQSS
jgi:uncharacterized protein (DUF1330 family)